MRVFELIRSLRQPCRVELRENNYFLCETKTDTKAMELFNNRKVKDWFPDPSLGHLGGLVINILGEEAD